MNPTFKSLTISGWRQFHNVSIEFHPRLTVITGANGAGKSTLLNLLTPHFGWHKSFLATPKKRRKDGAQQFFMGVRRRVQAPVDSGTVVGGIGYATGTFSSLHIGNEAQQYNVSIQNQQPVLGTFLPSHRAVPSFQPVPHISPSAILPDQAYTVYQSESIQRFSGGHSQGTIFRLKEALVSMAMFGAKSEFSPGDEATLRYFRGFVDVLRIVLPASLGFRDLSIRSTDVVLETETGSFMIDAASGGVMSLIDIAWQIFAFSNTTQVKKVNGFVVVMDEPENHLHPSMQRALLGNLVNAFPNAQFIVATHSPFMVSSVKDSSVYALRYSAIESEEGASESDDEVNVSKFVFSEKLDVIDRAGSASEILRDVLGVPVTIPLWVEGQLNALVAEYRNRELTVESLRELRSRMTALGFGEMYSTALAGVVGVQ